MYIRGERQVLVNLGEAGKGVNEVRMMSGQASESSSAGCKRAGWRLLRGPSSPPGGPKQSLAGPELPCSAKEALAVPSPDHGTEVACLKWHFRSLSV